LLVQAFISLTVKKLCTTIFWFMKSRNLVVLILLLIGVLVVWEGVGKIFPHLISSKNIIPSVNNQPVKVVNEQSVVVDVVRSVGPSVVTVGAKNNPSNVQNIPQDPFGFFFEQPQEPTPAQPKEDYIGSGFIVQKDGIIVTNKHVVSNPGLEYIIIDSKGNEYNIGNVYRDPLNDVAILKISNP